MGGGLEDEDISARSSLMPKLQPSKNEVRIFRRVCEQIQNNYEKRVYSSVKKAKTTNRWHWADARNIRMLSASCRNCHQSAALAQTTRVSVILISFVMFKTGGGGKALTFFAFMLSFKFSSEMRFLSHFSLCLLAAQRLTAFNPRRYTSLAPSSECVSEIHNTRMQVRIE